MDVELSMPMVLKTLGSDESSPNKVNSNSSILNYMTQNSGLQLQLTKLISEKVGLSKLDEIDVQDITANKSQLKLKSNPSANNNSNSRPKSSEKSLNLQNQPHLRKNHC